MKVIRALSDIYIPTTPEETSEHYLMYTRVVKGNLALVSDSFIKRLKHGTFKVHANVNEKFKRDKENKKKVYFEKVENADMGG